MSIYIYVDKLKGEMYMYRIWERLKSKRKIRKKSDYKIFNLAITMFVSLSLLNAFLIFNFMSLLNNIGTI